MHIPKQLAKSSTALIAGAFSGFCYGAISAGIGAAIAKEYEDDLELTSHISIPSIAVSAYIGCTIVKGVFGLILSLFEKIRARYLQDELITYEAFKIAGDVLLLSVGGVVGALIYSQSIKVTALSVGMGAMILHVGVKADKLFRWTLSKKPNEFEREADGLLNNQQTSTFGTGGR